uniref:Uncharacterized protein n=1 Tax=Timema poppense TaxID=170557 RepID=A0A7R9H0V6_TIMPO|nr:unnamed protein product [Timema poppensis]
MEWASFLCENGPFHSGLGWRDYRKTERVRRAEKDSKTFQRIELGSLSSVYRHATDWVKVSDLTLTNSFIADPVIVERCYSADACSECRVCGGYRLLPCAVCNGSKKSVHRNDFTAEFVALKCMNCDEVGLVKCYSC